MKLPNHITQAPEIFRRYLFYQKSHHWNRQQVLDYQSAKDKFEMMLRILKDQKTLPMATLEDLLAGTHTFEQEETPVGEVSDHVILYGRTGKPIKAKTKNQKKMVTQRLIGQTSQDAPNLNGARVRLGAENVVKHISIQVMRL